MKGLWGVGFCEENMCCNHHLLCITWLKWAKPPQLAVYPKGPWQSTCVGVCGQWNQEGAGTRRGELEAWGCGGGWGVGVTVEACGFVYWDKCKEEVMWGQWMRQGRTNEYKVGKKGGVYILINTCPDTHTRIHTLVFSQPLQVTLLLSLCKCDCKWSPWATTGLSNEPINR